MAITGELTKNGKNYVGFIASLALDFDVEFVPNKVENPVEGKDYPTWIVMGKTPRGRNIQVGAGWSRVSEAKNDYIDFHFTVGDKRYQMNAVQMPNSKADLVIIPYAQKRKK